MENGSRRLNSKALAFKHHLRALWTVDYQTLLLFQSFAPLWLLPHNEGLARGQFTASGRSLRPAERLSRALLQPLNYLHSRFASLSAHRFLVALEGGHWSLERDVSF